MRGLRIQLIDSKEVKIFSDYFSCFWVDSFEGLPPMLPGQLEEEMSRVGEKRWNKQTKINLTNWIDEQTQLLYDKFGICDEPIKPVIKKNVHPGYITATIKWIIPNAEPALI